MNREKIILKNKKGKPVSFIKEQTEDEIVFIRNVKKDSSLANKKIIIHTIDLERIREFQNIHIEVPSKRGVFEKLVNRAVQTISRNPVANIR